jgi:hypothetical protein
MVPRLIFGLFYGPNHGTEGVWDVPLPNLAAIVERFSGWRLAEQVIGLILDVIKYVAERG